MKSIQLWGRYIGFWMGTVMLGVGCLVIGNQAWQAVDWTHKAVVVCGILCGVLGVMCYVMAAALIQPVVKYCWKRLRHKEQQPFVAALVFKA